MIGLESIYFEKRKRISINTPTIMNFKKEKPLMKDSKEQTLPIAKQKKPVTVKPYIYGFCLIFL